MGLDARPAHHHRRQGAEIGGTRPFVDRGGASGSGSVLGVTAVPCWSFSLLSVHVCRSFDPLDLQDRTVTEKLRPKEDSHCRSFWSSTSVQITSRQEDPEGEDELEPAFQVESPQAIGRRAM